MHKLFAGSAAKAPDVHPETRPTVVKHQSHNILFLAFTLTQRDIGVSDDKNLEVNIGCSSVRYQKTSTEPEAQNKKSGNQVKGSHSDQKGQAGRRSSSER